MHHLTLTVAAGFDAAAGDVLGGCFVSPSCYAQMTHMLMTLSHGKLAVCLEGGYNFKSISKSALAVTKTLMGEPPDRLMDSSPTESAVATVRRVRSIQSQYWTHLYPKTAAHHVYGDRLHGKNHGTLHVRFPGSLFFRCYPPLSVQSAVRKLQAHSPTHLPHRNLQVI